MPEGDTIFRTARALNRALTGRPIAYFDSNLAALTQANDQTPFTGQTITKVESRGKWLLIHIAGSTSDTPSSKTKESKPSERVLATHMLMSGSWHLYQPGQPWQDKDANARIILEVANYQAVGFRIPIARIHTEQSLQRDRKIPRLDRDVLSESFDPAAAFDRLLARTNDELGDAILRQDVLAGVGNVFKSEICFILKLNPFRKVATLTKRQAKQIVATAQKLLAANVLEDSTDLIVTYSGKNRRTTSNATPGDNLWVYGRKGEPCRRCKTPIQRALQGRNARSTYWCPHCQPLPDALSS
jgi:endonuclease-8